MVKYKSVVMDHFGVENVLLHLLKQFLKILILNLKNIWAQHV